MKKAVISLILALVPIILLADPVEIDGIYYNLIEKGKIAEVTKNPNKYTGSVVIPEQVSYDGNSYNVISIEGGAFSSCVNLTSITIPNGVTNIGGWAFAYCLSLISVTIPNSVTSVGENAFYECSGIKSITISSSVTSIKEYTFFRCTGLTNVIIPNSVTSIGKNAFSDCTGLTSIVIPNNVSSIDEFAFAACSGLTNVTFPNSLTSIGWGAFQSCTGLTDITIPNSVTNIAGDAFSGCRGLTSIVIPNSVTSIEDVAFSDCTGLTSIVIPNSVTNIKYAAFSSCTGLTRIVIPDGMSNIGKWAFHNIPELKDVYCCAENVPETSNDAFEKSYIEYATLHVPANAINKYKETEPWKNFGKIVALDGATTQKCETPTISYENGELKMACATEGVEYVTDIADSDIKKHYSSEITLSATYNISVYATKAGFENSDVVNATLCWIDAAPKTEGITNGVTNVNARAVLIQNNGGIITVNGVDDGMRVSAYSLSGVEEASSISRNGAAVLNTNAQTGSTVIVKMGEKSVKVLMK